jgi:hypothetical protein
MYYIQNLQSTFASSCPIVIHKDTNNNHTHIYTYIHTYMYYIQNLQSTFASSCPIVIHKDTENILNPSVNPDVTSSSKKARAPSKPIPPGNSSIMAGTTDDL